MKKFLMTFVLCLSVLFANAQIATQNSNALDNIGVGITVGATTPLDFNSVFPLNTTVGVKFSKEFTPVFGLEIECLTSFGDNIYCYGVNRTLPGPDIYEPMNIHENGSVNTFVKTTNVGLNGVINWSNFFLGYKGTPRFFEVKTNTGFGWMHYFGNFTTNIVGGDVPAGKRNVLTAKTAVDLAFNVSKAHTFTVSPGIYWSLNEVENVKFNKNYAQFGVMVGYTYHFKTSNGTHHFKTYDIGAMNDEINHLRGALEECNNLAPRIVEKIIIRESEPVIVDNRTWVVTFETGSSKLSVEDIFILNQIDRNAVVDIVASASPEGTTEFNQKLSEDRAKVVADYLSNRGVTIHSTIGVGVDANTGRSAFVRVLNH